MDRVPYIPVLKESNVRKGFFEHGDFPALRKALPDYMKGFVTFAYRTGWRVSEIDDPADRIIIATAISLGAVLVTKDEKISSCPHVKTAW